MNAYKIPLEGRTYAQYSEYVTTLPWQFADGADRSIEVQFDMGQATANATLEGFEVGVPPIASISVPQSVTMRQARLALYGAGLLATIDAAVANMTGAAGDAARIEWEFSGEVQRNKPLVLGLAAVLGLSAAQLDNLFIEAAKL